jgi:UDP-N-acetylglucosamine 2-epimerase
MHHAQFMIGNSSSGMWEAPTLGLPVINTGNRQEGRFRGDNVIYASVDPCAIQEAIKSAVLLTHTPGHNPYGTQNSAAVAVGFLRQKKMQILISESNLFQLAFDSSG